MRIDVALSADDNYAKYCATVIYSAIENKAQDDEYVFHVIHGGLSDENLEKLGRFGNVTFHKVNEGEFSSYVRDTKLTWATPTLYRLKLASILDIERVIYLDCDIIVRSSLSELAKTDITDYILAGAPDVSHEQHLERLGLPSKGGNFYFNAGMVYMNLEKIRNEGIEEKLFDYLKNNWQKLAFSDQDVLNIVLFGKTLELKRKFNYIPLGRYHNKKLREALLKDVAIVHYAGVKPWERGFLNPFEAEFWEYFRKSGFLTEDETEELFLKYKESRTKLAQIMLYLKYYPLAILSPKKMKGLLDIIFD